MKDRKQMRFYLPPGLLRRARAGEHNFLNKINAVLQAAGFETAFEDVDWAEPLSRGYSLFHMVEPFRHRSVTIRRAYYYPFWQIERTNERWNWDIARAPFDPASIDPETSGQFYRFWQKRLYKDALQNIGWDGFIYVPLQGRLTRHRSFQTCSPVDMIRHTLANDPGRKVIATLHPKESYSAEDFAALEELQARHSRLELRMGGMEELLPRCSYVVTQNSSVAFAGFFFGKPCVTFARIDFHHITANVSRLGVKGAFEAVQGPLPSFEGYVWWFLQQMSINAGRPDAEDKIRARLRALGWPV